MSQHHAYHLLVAGCGTVGLACTSELAKTDSAPGIASLTLVDRCDIREPNAITCPPYAGHVGRPKSQRLAELASEWLPRSAPIRWLRASVETMPWPQLLASLGDGAPLIAVAGLDDWDSRVTLVADLRRAAAEATMHAAIIQCGLDRGQAQVAVFSADWSDPCPACGLNVLPEPDACVAYDAAGQLLRGDLQREARAAAQLVAEIVADLLRPSAAGRGWTNTKTNLTAEAGGANGFRRFTHTARRQPGCLGPHSPVGPLRWGREKAAAAS